VRHRPLERLEGSSPNLHVGLGKQPEKLAQALQLEAGTFRGKAERDRRALARPADLERAGGDVSAEFELGQEGDPELWRRMHQHLAADKGERRGARIGCGAQTLTSE
jgi:hypothetical protein